MTRIEREKQTVGQMVAIYCRGHQHAHFGEGHSNGRGALCAECTALLEYAHSRLDHCKYGEKKPTCEKCPIHCYKPAMREQIRTVMRYSGPRMLWHHPLAALRHLLSK